MAIEFGALPGVLTSPTKTFERLKEGANLLDGLKLWLLVGAVVTAIPIIVAKLAQSASAGLSGLSFSQGLTTSPAAVILYYLITLMAGLAIFLFFSWLVAKLSGAVGGKAGDFGRSAGLLGYVAAAFNLFIGIPLAVIQALVSVNAVSTTARSFGPGGGLNIGAFMALMALGIVGLLVMVWQWLVAGKASAAANGSTWGQGILAVFLAALIVGVILFAGGITIGFYAAYSALL